MSQISLQADETYMDERLDKFLSAMLPDQSRSYLQKIIKDGNVLVNGEPKKSSYRLEDGDEVTADLPELKSPDIEPENIPLDILYEDEAKGNGCTSIGRTLYRYIGQCSALALSGTAVRDQWSIQTRNRSPDRQGYHRCTCGM